jgi:glycosyltransferase involved in cell wall biosynthesis
VSALPTKTQRISAFVICCNEERNIRRCLQSVTWCDEIVIIDSGSTDRTLEICREFTDRILHQPWRGFVRQKRFGLECCTGDWVLNLDADEEVSEELREEMLQVVNDPSNTNTGFELLRVVFYLGKWWRKGGWYPEFRLRLLKRSSASWGGVDPHERALVQGETRRLGGELRHYTYNSIFEQIRSLNSHSQAAAESLFSQGERVSLPEILARSCGRFFKFYLLKKGFLEGTPGFFVGIIEAFYVFLKYIKLWELHRSSSTAEHLSQ